MNDGELVLTNIFDYAEVAKQKLAPAVWHYIDGGSGDELTRKENRLCLDQIKIMPRVLANQSEPDMRIDFFGQVLSSPLMVAPLAYQKLANIEGELATLKATVAQDIGFCSSTLASTKMESLSEFSSLHYSDFSLWFQLYIQPNWEDTINLIRRAENSGYTALVITVDAPVNGLRNREAKHKFSLPDNVRAENLLEQEKHSVSGLNKGETIGALLTVAPSWKTIEKIREATCLPITLKGILNPIDAKIAVSIGVDALVVSNHGGRILDGVPASIDMLPIIRQEVGADHPLIFDSGIRRGADIFKAIALGADLCLIGRPILYGLAVGGAKGVAHVIKILKDELQLTMSLTGCNQLSDISKSNLR